MRQEQTVERPITYDGYRTAETGHRPFVTIVEGPNQTSSERPRSHRGASGWAREQVRRFGLGTCVARLTDSSLASAPLVDADASRSLLEDQTISLVGTSPTIPLNYVLNPVDSETRFERERATRPGIINASRWAEAVVITPASYTQFQLKSIVAAAPTKTVLVLDAAAVRSSEVSNWPKVFTFVRVLVVTTEAANLIAGSSDEQAAYDAIRAMLPGGVLVAVNSDSVHLPIADQFDMCPMIERGTVDRTLLNRFGGVVAVGIAKGMAPERASLAAIAAVVDSNLDSLLAALLIAQQHRQNSIQRVKIVARSRWTQRVAGAAVAAGLIGVLSVLRLVG